MKYETLRNFKNSMSERISNSGTYLLELLPVKGDYEFSKSLIEDYKGAPLDTVDKICVAMDTGALSALRIGGIGTSAYFGGPAAAFLFNLVPSSAEAVISAGFRKLKCRKPNQ
jgi:hypothetical protein